MMMVMVEARLLLRHQLHKPPAETSVCMYPTSAAAAVPYYARASQSRSHDLVSLGPVHSRPRAGEWVLGAGSELRLHNLGSLGSTLSSPSGVRNGAPAANAFWTHSEPRKRAQWLHCHFIVVHRRVLSHVRNFKAAA